MQQIFIAKEGQQHGPYTLAEVKQHLQTGRFSLDDLGWFDGAPAWIPLHQVPGVTSGTRPPAIPANVPPAPVIAHQPRHTSGLAVASLILGIVSWFTVGLPAIPAVICAHLSLSRIKHSAGAVGGWGMAVAGLILGYLSMIFLVGLLAALALPAITGTMDKAQATKSLAQARQIGVACRQYAADHGGAFPPSLQNLAPTYVPDESIFVSPLAKNTAGPSYDYTSGLRDTDPPDRVLLRDHYASKRGYRAIVYVDARGELKRER
jgi:hypothetical protein